ncbi:MAG: hypothetical protein ACYC27_22055 [Armatimonadota bacterium]
MIRRSVLFVIAVLFMCAFSVQAFAQDAPVTDAVNTDALKLEYKFKPGDISRYKMVMDMNVNVKMPAAEGMEIPSMPVKLVFVYNQQVQRLLENGDAEVISTMELMKMTMMGTVQEIPVNQIPKITMVMSKDGSVKSIQGMEKIMNSLGGMPLPNIAGSGRYSLFPIKPLMVGESWIQDIPSPFGTGTMHTEGKLLSKDAKVGGYTAASYSENASGDICIKPPTPPADGENAVPAQGPQIDLTGKFNVKGNGNFAINEGKMISSKGTMELQMSMGMPTSIGAAGESMNINMTGSYDMFLLPPAKTK